MKKITNQHGDVLLIKIDKIPLEAKKQKIKNGFILERGEGVHTHVVKDVSNVEVLTIGDRMFLKVSEPTEIDHEEHGVQTIDPGFYEKEIERQFDYENEIERRVLD